jgi:hypothetical protein
VLNRRLWRQSDIKLDEHRQRRKKKGDGRSTSSIRKEIGTEKKNGRGVGGGTRI